MKRNEWMAIIATSFLMFALCLSATAQNNKPVYNKQGHTPHGCRTCPCVEIYAFSSDKVKAGEIILRDSTR